MKEQIKALAIKYKTPLIIAGVLILIWIIWYMSKDSAESSESSETSNKSLAECLKEKGAKFYGSASCGYCKKQKEMFGADAANLPYVECLDPKNAKACADAKLVGYPTWIFADGTRQSGLVQMDQLKAKSGC